MTPTQIIALIEARRKYARKCARNYVKMTKGNMEKGKLYDAARLADSAVFWDLHDKQLNELLKDIKHDQ